MGIIAGVLFTVPAYRYLVTDAAGHLTIPFWIVLMAHAAIALGTLSGGWRIVHTVGSKITKLVPMGGFAAETAGAVTLFTSSLLGIPVSTTHVITGAIVGVGSLRNMRAVRWGVAGPHRVGLAADHPHGRDDRRRGVRRDYAGGAAAGVVTPERAACAPKNRRKFGIISGGLARVVGQSAFCLPGKRIIFLS